MKIIEFCTEPIPGRLLSRGFAPAALLTALWIVLGCGSGLTPASQSSLAFAPIQSHSFGDAPFAISASSPSTGSISYQVLSGPASISGNMVTLKGAGDVVLVANQAPAAPFGAQTAKADLTVNRASPILAFAPVPAHILGDPPFPVVASSASTGTIRYTVISGPAALTGNLITLTGTGTVIVRASQDADANYSAQVASVSFAATSNSPILVTASQSSVVIGSSAQCSATKDGVALQGGQWIVLGGTGNGTIGSDGVYHAPNAVPTPNSITIGYTFGNTTYTTVIGIIGQAPSILSTTPTIVVATNTRLLVTGTGFLPGALVLLNGTPVSTSYTDSSHLYANLNLATPQSGSFQLTVQNPDPNGLTSAPHTLAAQFPEIGVLPSQLVGGSVTLTLSGSGFQKSSVVFLDGKPLVTNVISSTSITATGYLPPWKTGSVVVELFADSGNRAVSQTSVPIAPTAVSYDVAARFATQAAFGPRPDVVEHIQQIGLDAFITEQLKQPVVMYDPNVWSPNTFFIAASSGNSLLRLRVAYALQSFIVPSGNSFLPGSIPAERMFERDATANFRQLLGDVASDPNIGIFLNLINNPMPLDPNVHPNQNFARELMQLFTMGPQRLNEDGTLMRDANGLPIPTYSQNTVIDLTRALTGWNLADPIDPAYTAWGVDYSQPLNGHLAWYGRHDENAKLLFDSVALPPGQTIEQDRDAALDAVFYHPNVPPFVSRLLIQHLVKSNPSPDYIYRISQVFKDDGTGVRGNLSAVVRAILLDPEARLGDTEPAADDGFLQDPIVSQIFTMSILQSFLSDAQASFYPGMFGAPLWHASTVFGFYSPDYRIPGTTINAPEFALFNNIYVLQRSQVLWKFVSDPSLDNGSYAGSSWLFKNFTTVPDMVDALNHLAYHGRMSPTQQAVIVNYCSQMNPFLTLSQLQTAVFLALNSDSYVVTH